MADLVSFSIVDGVAVATCACISSSPHDMQQVILASLARAKDAPEVKAMVLAGCWNAKAFGDYATAAPLVAYLAKAIEQCPKPVIAAIEGATRDAGFELALACHYRLALSSASFTFTQAKSGLMPAAGATQRLPRIVGATAALSALALSISIKGDQAFKDGLIDDMVEDDVVKAAVALAQSCPVAIPTKDRPTPTWVESDMDDFILQNGRKIRGLDAPAAIIALVQQASTLSFAEGLVQEQAAFARLRHGPQYAALTHAANCARMASIVPELDGIAPRPVAATAVIGAGTMGTGITLALLSAGWPVTLFERDATALERGVERVRKTLQDNVKSGRINQVRADAAFAALKPVLDMGALDQADLIIEAAYETMEVKQAIFTQLDRIARPGAILASNTSYLDLDAIANTTARSADVVGLHFFSPANIMKLLEIVRGKATAPDVLATALAVAKPMGKVAVISGNAYGFIGNRMLAVRRKEAEAMAVEGAAPHQIDAVLETFGFPMGPFRMGDLAGLDLGWSIEKSTGSTIRERLCEAGRRGQKTGAGFYDYDATGKPVRSAQAEEIIAGFAHDNTIAQRAFDDAAILDRLLWPMIDEGARLLAEGIARNADDIDAVWLHGYGWPASTGGPMYHARAVGLEEVCRRLDVMGRPASPALRALGA